MNDSGGIFDSIRESDTGNGHVSYFTKKTQFSEFERQLMTGNRCRALLNMRCVFEGRGTRIYYAADGCMRLDEILKSGMAGARDVFSICSAFLETLRLCEDFLLKPSDLPFDSDEHIFCRHRASGVRFMYIPGYKNEMGIREKLADIADTAIEYCMTDDRNIMMLSDFKGRLYSVSDELRPLMLLTEASARRCVQISNEGKQSNSEESAEGGESAESSALTALKEEAGMYKTRKSLKSRLRDLIDGLVS